MLNSLPGCIYVLVKGFCQGCLGRRLCLQDVKEDTDLMSDDDDEDEMEDLDALAKGMDRGRTAPLPKPASAAEITTNIGSECIALHTRA